MFMNIFVLITWIIFFNYLIAFFSDGCLKTQCSSCSWKLRSLSCYPSIRIHKLSSQLHTALIVKNYFLKPRQMTLHTWSCHRITKQNVPTSLLKAWIFLPLVALNSKLFKAKMGETMEFWAMQSRHIQICQLSLNHTVNNGSFPYILWQGYLMIGIWLALHSAI